MNRVGKEFQKIRGESPRITNKKLIAWLQDNVDEFCSVIYNWDLSSVPENLGDYVYIDGNNIGKKRIEIDTVDGLEIAPDQWELVFVKRRRARIKGA